MQRAQTPRHRAPALATMAAAVVRLLVGPLGANAAAAPPIPSPPTAFAAPGSACPAPVPVAAVTPGLTGTGWTVSRGSTSEPFTVTVLGVLPNAIGSGVDLIVFEGASPALDAAGGIWAGMSGSPVYTGDGRLLGAVSYGFTTAPSKIGGITPAAAMMELLTQPDAVAAAAPARVPLPVALRRDVVARAKVSQAQAAAGLAPLPIPLAVSGLNPGRLAALNTSLERSGSPLRAYAGSAAPATPAPTGSLFPGSNFAAAIAYGDLTMAAIGTTTTVCQGRALAFGHPMLFAGPVSMSAHRTWFRRRVVARPT